MHTLQQTPGMGKVQTEIELLTKQMLLVTGCWGGRDCGSPSSPTIRLQVEVQTARPKARVAILLKIPHISDTHENSTRCRANMGDAQLIDVPSVEVSPS